MIIKAKWKYYTGKYRPGEKEYCDLINIDYCCDDALEAERESFLHFGEYDSVLNKDTNINIIKCSPYPEGAVFDEMSIKYCPFCGKKIIIEVEDL